MRRISSRQNPLVRRFRDLARARGADGATLLDGEHLVQEALDAGVALEAVAFADRIADAHADGLAARVERAGAEALRVPETVLAAMSPVRQPSGIVGIARLDPASVDDILAPAPQLVLVLAGVQDAGNVGAIVRTADACGATGLIAAEGTADPFGWKALRGAMGSSFRVPIAVRQPLAATIARIAGASVAAARGATADPIQIVAMTPHDGTPMAECDFRGPIAVILGSEGAGLPDEVAGRADLRVTIPMRPPVESLNVAVTAALILYEASQQRRRQKNR